MKLVLKRVAELKNVFTCQLHIFSARYLHMNIQIPASSHHFYPVEPPTARKAPRRHNFGKPKPIRPPPPINHLNETNPRKRRMISTEQRELRMSLNPVVPNGPISPQEALDKYPLLLTPYEKDEIVNFSEIYYLGRRNCKITPSLDDPNNMGFDDENNNANLIVGDHLAYRFEIQELFGSGAFGQVIKCVDHKLKIPVAVKVIVNTDQMHEQGRIEAQILAAINKAGSRHIVKAYDFFIFRSHVCITFEILGMNLYELSEVNEFRPLPHQQVRMYAMQMLSGLEVCHKLGAVHCDIKPENVLLVQGSQSLVKVIDFGSGCFNGHQKYEYIQSRFYRAPEVMLGIPYGPPMDIWSTALVLIELLIGRPIFPGDDELEELAMITELLGKPPMKLVLEGKRRDEFYDENYELKQTPATETRKPGAIRLEDIIASKDRHLFDFLYKCLTWDPAQRLTATSGLQHPWIKTREITISNSNKGSRLLPDLISTRRVK